MYDIAVVGAGIVGLAHALAAAKAGKKVAVFDREERAVGASIRNFGFVTITGQERGVCWQRAMRSRDIWTDIAPKADIQVLHRGLTVAAHSDEAMAVHEAFKATEMGEGCELLNAGDMRQMQPTLKADGLKGGLYSPHEVRVEAREVIAQLTAYLAEAFGVTFHFSTAVHAIDGENIHTSRGRFQAPKTFVCSGPDLTTLYPAVYDDAGVTNTKLQMFRLAPQRAGWKLNGSVMADTSLVRYLGFSELPESAPLAARLDAERPWLREHGVHLIVVQSADGSLVVGDSHHDARSPDPFVHALVENRIMELVHETLDITDSTIVERWAGVYPKQKNALWLVQDPSETVRIATITGGMGMSTAFAFAEDTMADIL